MPTFRIRGEPKAEPVVEWWLEQACDGGILLRCGEVGQWRMDVLKITPAGALERCTLAVQTGTDHYLCGTPDGRIALDEGDEL